MLALRRTLTASVAVLVAAVVGEQLYRRRVRERTLNWGATAEEAARSLPGDGLLAEADIVATRAITIGAPASAVWPWLVQMGPGRAGAYTYDWIENLFGLNMHSADRIHPEWQGLEVGEVLRSGEGKPGMRVEIVEPERALVNRSEAGDWVWAFVLVPENGSTRLISRNRISMKGAAAGQRLGMLVIEPVASPRGALLRTALCLAAACVNRGGRGISECHGNRTSSDLGRVPEVMCASTPAG